MNKHSTVSVYPERSDFSVICKKFTKDQPACLHPEIVVGYVKKGSATVAFESGSYSLVEGNVFFAAPNSSYGYTEVKDSEIIILSFTVTPQSAVVYQYFPQEIIRSVLIGSCTRFAQVNPESESYVNILDAINIIVKMKREKPDFYQFMVCGQINRILFELFSNKIVKVADTETHSKKYRVMFNITGYIDRNYCKGISLDEVSDAVGISRYYISHLFKELLNTTFIGYVNELRLSHAASLLLTTNLTVIEISAQSGFNNLSNFNRAFKLKYGKTPTAFRRA